MRHARGGPLRLLKSLRGRGSLLWGRRTARPVSYCLDLYGQGALLSGNGDLSGEFTDLVDRSPADPRLLLESGQEVRVVLSDITADAVSIELISPVSAAIA